MINSSFFCFLFSSVIVCVPFLLLVLKFLLKTVLLRFHFRLICLTATGMSGEVFDGQDAGYVPENPDFPQNHSDELDEGNVIDESGFHQLQPDEHDAGNLTEDANPPENEFDGHDVGDMPENADSHPQEHAVTEEEEEHRDGGDVTENFTSQEKQGPEDVSKATETKKWPGWPGENVFRMLVPVQKVGSIIGRKGEFIKKITEETKARIKILDGPPGTTERAVSLLSNFLSFMKGGMILDIHCLFEAYCAYFMFIC